MPVAGMGRLDRVLVATTDGIVELPWTSRFELLERVRRLHGGAEVVHRFENVRATRPVTLDHDSKLLLMNVLGQWLNGVNADALPPGLMELRAALIDDLKRDAPDNAG